MAKAETRLLLLPFSQRTSRGREHWSRSTARVKLRGGSAAAGYSATPLGSDGEFRQGSRWTLLPSPRLQGTSVTLLGSPGPCGSRARPRGWGARRPGPAHGPGHGPLRAQRPSLPLRGLRAPSPPAPRRPWAARPRPHLPAALRTYSPEILRAQQAHPPPLAARPAAALTARAGPPPPRHRRRRLPPPPSSRAGPTGRKGRGVPALRSGRAGPPAPRRSGPSAARAAPAPPLRHRQRPVTALPSR